MKAKILAPLFAACASAIVLGSCAGSAPRIDNMFGVRYPNLEMASSVVAKELSQGYKENRQLKLAFFPFVDRSLGAPSELGSMFSDQVKQSLFKERDFVLLERVQLKEALQELSLGMNDLFDDAKATKVGKFAGADAVVIGDYRRLSTPGIEYYQFSVRIVDVSDAHVLALSQVSIDARDFAVFADKPYTNAE
jgi:curli biogenesis system outer membrane secretion channel CsgG